MAQFGNTGDPAAALMEECSEVLQVIAKKIRFNGDWDEVPPGKKETRWQQLCSEMDDLMFHWLRLKEERSKIS